MDEHHRCLCGFSGALLASGLLALAGLSSNRSFPDEPVKAGRFRFAEVKAGSLGVWEENRPVLVYNHGLQTKPAAPQHWQRSSYVHPLHGLDGEVLTDDFPSDHYHHRGLFWAWPHIKIGGTEYDLWVYKDIRHQFERWRERQTQAAGAVLAVQNGWYVGKQRVVKEEVRFQISPATPNERVIDLELRWTALDEPVTLQGRKGKSYGGLSLRFAPRKETVITTADGIRPKDLNLARLGWADLSATFAGAKAPSGIALFVNPHHPGFPPTWITRHYGFLGVGWPGVEPFVLQPGKTVTCRYRILVHRGVGNVTRLLKVQAALAPAR